MKRRTWFKTVAAFGVAAMFPWVKQAKAVDQTERIRRLHASDGKSDWVRDTDEWRLSISDGNGHDDSAVWLFWDRTVPVRGKYRSACCAIKKRLAQTMDDETLCRKICIAMWRSVCRNHRVGLFSLGPPPEWIT